jgi:pentatricopeptide repeat protein
VLIWHVNLHPACADLTTLQYIKDIDHDIIRSAFLSDFFVRNTFVDLYAKYGVIEDASRVFNEIIE